MKISSLQKARYEYSPKLPGMLRNGISNICVKEGEETSSVADQEKIKALFPNTYGKKEITFAQGENTSTAKKQVVGVILSGGQAPGDLAGVPAAAGRAVKISSRGVDGKALQALVQKHRHMTEFHACRPPFRSFSKIRSPVPPWPPRCRRRRGSAVCAARRRCPRSRRSCPRR